MRLYFFFLFILFIYLFVYFVLSSVFGLLINILHAHTDFFEELGF